MARLSNRYNQERTEERVRNFMDRRLRRLGDHEDQSTRDENEMESETPSVRSTDFGWCQVIAALEILGGGTGLVVGTLFPLLNSSLNLGPGIVALDILFLLSIIAGVYLWGNHKFGYHLSVLLFVLQIPQFALGGISFQFVSAISITPILNFTTGGMGVGLAPLMGPGGEFAIRSAYNPDLLLSIGINIYAVIASYMVAARLVGQVNPRVLASPQLPM